MWTNWYANKQKREVGLYIDNKEDGEWIYMSENGDKILNGYFNKGEKVNIWSHWYSGSRKKKQIQYNKGLIISELCWDKIGEIISCL